MSIIMNTNRNGLDTLYIMDECWSLYHIVLYFPKSHVKLRTAFDDRIRKLRESGLTEYWLRQELGRMDMVAGRKRSPVAENEPLSLDKHLKEGFFLLLLCLAGCCLVFATEMMWVIHIVK